MSERRERDRAQWVTLVASCAVVLVVLGLVVAQLFGPDDPAAPMATVSGIREAPDGSHHVETTVTNEGDATAANVQVSASLLIDGELTEAEQVVDFVPPDADERIVFVFADDPAEGTLTVEVSSFSEP